MTLQDFAARQMAPLLTANGAVSIVVGIVHGTERQVLAFGSPLPLTAEANADRAIFEIGSLTKTFTALLLAVTASRGLVALDQPVSELAPEFAFLPEAITLQRLATHTSGLPRLPGNILRSVLREPANPYAHYSRDDLLAYLRKVQQKDIQARLDKILYSNLGAGLLGEALCAMLGVEYEEAVREHVGAPLGLADTAVELDDARQSRFVHPHAANGKRTAAFRMGSLQGAGALHASTGDLLAFIAAHLQPDTSMLREAIELTLQVRATELAAPSTYERFVLKIASLFRRPAAEPAQPAGVGLGWIRMTLAETGTPLWFHNGATTGSRSFAAFVPSGGVGVVACMNQGISEWDLFRSRPSLDEAGFAILAELCKHDPGWR
jgi:CubicO group peptidase (beta-lactamase class C family)